MLRVLIVFVLAQVVLVRGLGDENQYLAVHGVSDLKGKFLCEPALFGSRLNNTGLKAEIVLIRDVCSNPTPSLASLQCESCKRIVIAYHDDCLYGDEVFYLAKAKIGAIAVIVINRNPSPPVLAMQSYVHEGEIHIPSCMISNYDGTLIESAITGYETPSATLHNGASEELTVKVTDSFLTSSSAVQVWLQDPNASYVSAKLPLAYPSKQDGADVYRYIIPDFYDSIVVVAKKYSASSQPSIVVTVSDGFHSALNWQCSPGNHAISPPYNDAVKWPKAKSVGNTTDGMRIWTSGDSSEDYVTCLGQRFQSAITKNGYKYLYNPQFLTAHAAEQKCQELLGPEAHLASIHSLSENDLARSLVAPNLARGPWIGLTDEKYEGTFAWTDYTSANFYNWMKGQPNDYNSDQDCVVLLKDGYWNDVSCTGEKNPSLCKQRIGDDPPPEPSRRKCSIFWDTRNTAVGAPAQPLGDTKFCASKSKYSCCSASFINEKIATKYEALIETHTSPKCQRLLSEMLCYDCLDTQSSYMEFTNNVVTVNICEDTCISFYEACKHDPGFAGMPKSAAEVCDAFNSKVNEYMKFNVVSASSDGCFRVDGFPPNLLSTVAVPGSSKVKLVFDEPITIACCGLKVYEMEGEEVLRVWDSISKYDPGLSFEKTTWEQDTIVLDFLKLERCNYHPERKYAFMFPNYAITDMAGNQLGRQVYFSQTQIQCNDRSTHGGSGTFLWVVFFLAIFGAIGTVTWKYKLHSRLRSTVASASTYSNTDMATMEESINLRPIVVQAEEPTSDNAYVRMDDDNSADSSLLRQT